MTLNAKIGVLLTFWRFRAATHIATANCAKITKVRPLDQNNLLMKFSTLKVVYTSFNFGPCVQRILHTGASNLGIPSKCALSAAQTAAATRDRLRHLA